ncbi:hypothetical protein ACS0TY_025830 [Phlomoides rotata]
MELNRQIQNSTTLCGSMLGAWWCVWQKMIELGTREAIIFTASVAATKGGMSRMDYHMSKHAVLGIVRSGSLQLGVHGNMG